MYPGSAGPLETRRRPASTSISSKPPDTAARCSAIAAALNKRVAIQSQNRTRHPVIDIGSCITGRQTGRFIVRSFDAEVRHA